MDTALPEAKRFPGFKIRARHAASAVAVAASLYFSISQIQNDRARLQRDLEMNSAVLAESLRAAFEPMIERGSSGGIQDLIGRFEGRGRLAGVVLYDREGRVVAEPGSLGGRLRSRPAMVSKCLNLGEDVSGYERVGKSRMRINALWLRGRDGPSAVLAVFYDASYIESRLARSRWDSARRMAIQAAVFLAAVAAFSRFIK